MSQRLIDQLLSQRKSWVEVAPGKRVQIIRPPESDIGAFIRIDGAGRSMVLDLAHVTQYVCGWDGFTEADLLGSAVGASDVVPFDAALWAVVVTDRADWIQAVAAALIAAIVKHFEQKDTAEKN